MTYTPQNAGQTIKGLYTKLGMLKVISDNLANATTVGYKRRIPESLTFGSILKEANPTPAKDVRTGEFKKTHKMLDLAVEGNAGILVDTKNGLEHTRGGRLSFNNNGDLVTQEGHKVVIVEKTDKPIELAKEPNIKINKNGEIFVGTTRYGRIAVKVFDNKKPVRLHQGYIEGSNVNLSDEMISFSMLNRSLEASEKMLGMEASVDRDLIEKYGRNV